MMFGRVGQGADAASILQQNFCIIHLAAVDAVLNVARLCEVCRRFVDAVRMGCGGIVDVCEDVRQAHNFGRRVVRGGNLEKAKRDRGRANARAGDKTRHSERYVTH